MSLINDALRKAQKQRTGEAPPLASMPAIGGESAARIAKRSKPPGFYALLVRIGVGVLILAVVIIGGVVLLRKKAPDPGSQQPPIVAQTPTTKPADQAPAVVAPPATSPTPTSAFVVPVTTPSTPIVTAKTEPPKAEAPKPAASVATAAVPVPPKPEPAKPVAALKLEPKAISFIESLRVAGIRASATDSKVLMNDRVYRIGSIVEHEMGLKLTGITSNSLTFEDERGGTYTRTF